ncbi:MAG: class I SAM-dependent methyltransferase [Ilumatobacteraceae bacterium]
MWEQRYGTEAYLYGTEPNEFLRANAHLLPAGPTMCLAEGEGRNAVHLAGTGRQVHSVDLTEAGVAKTLRLAQQLGVQVAAVVGDVAEFDLGVDRWPAIVSIFAHMPPAVRRGLHARVVAALTPGGVLLLEAYTPAQIGRGTGGPAVPEMTMTLDGLRDELAGLEFLHAMELEREVVEGPGHTGVGAVVQVIARRGGALRARLPGR